MAKVKIPVTRRALVQRINRALAKENEKLVTTRGALAVAAFGDYHVAELHNGNVTAQHVDIEKLGRELGVLRPYEVLRDE